MKTNTNITVSYSPLSCGYFIHLHNDNDCCYVITEEEIVNDKDLNFHRLILKKEIDKIEGENNV